MLFSAPMCTIIPPYMLRALASSGDPHLEGHARRTLAHDEELRRERFEGVLPRPRTRARRARGAEDQAFREIHDAEHGADLPGRLVRGEGDPATEDASVTRAYDGLGATWQLWFEAFERSSLDDKGLGLVATVHYRRGYDNAFWNGEQMVFGDGDGEVFADFTSSLDVIGHELAHGVTQYTSGLNYQDESGALNEHVSDVFGVLVKQHVLGQNAADADWLVGAELLLPGVKGRGLRDMLHPGTAYDDPRLGKDPQPATYADYIQTTADHGGVHLNSGIPNRAFATYALALGGPAWGDAGLVWHDTITGDIRADCDFATFAALTLAAATARFGPESVQVRELAAAWALVEVVPAAPAPPKARSRRRSTSPAPRAAAVEVTRSGGFAGQVRTATAALADLPTKDRAHWRSLLADRTLEELAARAPEQPWPDAFVYGVRCAAPSIDVTIPEPGLTDEVRSLFDRTLEGG
ncbi:MAG: M4 family metallopeptidase [Tetrasphaera sp.]|nr:M4 family metallopeptidase [Tetrasphaera sp.]